MQSADNLLLVGPPGVGKSHLAIALGMKACEQGVRTLFSSATALIDTQIDDRSFGMNDYCRAALNDTTWAPTDPGMASRRATNGTKL
jgi:hypothetical protein